MSREFKKHYSSFNRNILREFMTGKELTEMDKKYSKAKLDRMIRKTNKVISDKNNIIN